jgi:hypothetical protein
MKQPKDRDSEAFEEAMQDFEENAKEIMQFGMDSKTMHEMLEEALTAKSKTASGT